VNRRRQLQLGFSAILGVADTAWVFPLMSGLLATEKHYSPTEISALWGFAPSKVREIFIDEPGVLKIGEPSRREGKRLVRGYHTLRIPESVVLRVHARLSAPSSGTRRVR
jgi:hypothetical protein